MKDKPSTPNIVMLLNRRQLGLPRKEKGRSVRHSISNYRCDFQLLKCLLSVEDTYLEVIAGKQVPRMSAPSYGGNRLFTNNYRTWFNLCTSPTSGPILIRNDIFHPENSCGSAVNPRPRILDAITMNPPNGCTPLSNSQHLPCVVLISKDGWLYQYSLEDATCLNKMFIPTKFFVNSSSKTSASQINNDLRAKETERIKERISSLVFTYSYLEEFDVHESKVLITSSCITSELHFIAYVIIALFPLRIINHFVTASTTKNLKVQLLDKMLILTVKAGSLLSLYGLQDILGMFDINSKNIQLGQSKTYSNPSGTIRGCVGDCSIGFPYTSNPIILEEYREWFKYELFKTKAIKHIFRIGGIPFHFAVPIDVNCNNWSLRKLSDGTEVSRFHVNAFSQEGFISGLNFHNDQSGRLLIINKETVVMYQISERYKAQRNGVTGQSTVDISSVKSTAEKDQAGFLRLVGSPLGCHHNSVERSFVKKCFEIRLDESGEETNHDSQGGQIRPQLRSSYGRQLRNPVRLSMAPIVQPKFKIMSVSYEDELDIIAVLHFKGCSSISSLSFSETFYDVMVSLYENQSGKKINSVVVERNLLASDFTNVTFAMDTDTIIYARTGLLNMVTYKVLRFCRKR